MYLDTKLLVIALALLVLILLAARYRRRLVVPFLVALALATVWTLYFRYEYAGTNLFLWNRINVYPLIWWTVGLAGLQVLRYELPRRYRLTLAIPLYLAVLLAVEAIGYHLLNIRLNSQFTSLLNLGVIHAPVVMKIFYVCAGPAYFVLVDRLQSAHRFAATKKVTQPLY